MNDDVPTPPDDLEDDRWGGFETSDMGGPQHRAVVQVPMALQAEEAVLGAMLMSTVAIREVVELGVRAEHFERPAHQIVFAAIMAVVERDGGIDEVSVIHQLQATRVPSLTGGRDEVAALPAVGGAAAVMTLAERVPAVSMAKRYAATVLEFATRRQLLAAGNAIVESAVDGTVPTSTAIEQAEQQLHAVSVDQSRGQGYADAFDGATSVERWIERYAAMQEDPAEYERRTLSWGRVELDERLGRMEPGDVFGVAGWTKHGKTWQVLDVVEAVMRQGHPALIASSEMNDLAVTSRLVAMGGFNHDKVREQRIPFPDIRDRLDAMRNWTRRTLQGMTTISRIRAEVARARLEGRPFRVVVIDHLGLLQREAGQQRMGQTEFLEWATAQIKMLAEEYELTVLLVVQLSRPPKVESQSVHPEYKRPPVSTDLKGASGIEQICTSVMFVYRDMSKQTGRQLAERTGMLTFPFHRHKGQPRRVDVRFSVPSDGEPDGAYRFVPIVLEGTVDDASESVGMVAGVDLDGAVAPTPAVQQTLDVVQKSFGSGVHLVPAPVDDDPTIY